jgi:hypothetical protein
MSKGADRHRRDRCDSPNELALLCLSLSRGDSSAECIFYVLPGYQQALLQLCIDPLECKFQNRDMFKWWNLYVQVIEDSIGPMPQLSVVARLCCDGVPLRALQAALRHCCKRAITVLDQCRSS